MNAVELIPIIESLYIKYGLPFVFVSSFIEISPLGWLIPGGVMLAIGGFFAYGRPIYFIGTIIFGWFGAFLTFLLAYYFGATIGERLVEKLNQKDNAERAKLLLEKHGATILTTSMLASLTRFWIAFVAGTKGYSFSSFVFYAGIASLTWTSFMVTIGYMVGAGRSQLESNLAKIGILSWLLVFLAIFVIYRKVKKEFSELKDIKQEKN